MKSEKPPKTRLSSSGQKWMWWEVCWKMMLLSLPRAELFPCSMFSGSLSRHCVSREMFVFMMLYPNGMSECSDGCFVNISSYQSSSITKGEFRTQHYFQLHRASAFQQIEHFPQQKATSVLSIPPPKMCWERWWFAKWNMPPELTVASTLFSFSVSPGHHASEDSGSLVRAAVQHCVYLTSWVWHSVWQSVSLSNTPSEALAEQHGHTPRGWTPSHPYSAPL